MLSLLLAAATTVSPVAPTGPWVLAVEENMCLLQRTYPTDKGKVTLVFQPLLDLPSMELFVLTSDKSEKQYTGDFKVQVAPGTRTYTGHYYSVHMPGGDTRATRIPIDRVALDGLRDGDTMTIQAKPVALSLTIVRPEKARPAMDKCIADLKRSWGIDPDRDAQAVTRLEGNPAKYFNSESYPAEALSKGVYGRVIAMLNVAADGTVSNCRIVSSAGKALNEGTCTAARRIRFTPPRDANGKAIATTYLLPVRWTMPGAPD